MNNHQPPSNKAGFADADLVIIILVSFVGLVVALAPPLAHPIVRAAVEAPVLLFFPGYSLIAALFPRDGGIPGFDRVALSFGLSIAIVPLLAFVLNYVWNLSLLSVAAAVITFTIAASAVACVRRHALPPQERYSARFQTVVLLLKELRPRVNSRLELGLVVLVVCAILFSASALAYSFGTPAPRESYTEFYLLGPAGSMQGYPTNLTLGQAQSVTVGIANHENRDVNYTLVVQLSDALHSSALYSGYQVVANGQTSEKAISLIPDRTGETMRLDFFLYRGAVTSTPYRQTYLLVNVTASPHL